MLRLFRKGQPDPSSPSQELAQACLDLLAAYKTMKPLVDMEAQAAQAVNWTDIDFAQVNAEYVLRKVLGPDALEADALEGGQP